MLFRRVTRSAALLVAPPCLRRQGCWPAADWSAAEFFQFKPEAIATFDAIIADFERGHPDVLLPLAPMFIVYALARRRVISGVLRGFVK